MSARELTALAVAGEMAERCRTFDWSATSLGPAASWPTSLKTIVGVALGSRFPMAVWWGRDLVQIYNDGYRPMLGDKHPASLGASAPRVWAEIWDVVGPLARGVLDGGAATWNERLLLMLNRKGFLEEAYFTFSYSPIPDDAGAVGGVLVTVKEVTEEVQDERQLRLLRDLADPGAAARTVDEVCRDVLEVLGQSARDLPFALLYLVPRGGETGSPVAPAPGRCGPAAIHAGPECWPLDEVAQSGVARLVEDVAGACGELPAGFGGERPRRAIVLPLARANSGLDGFLVAGISPHRQLDERYRGLFHLVAERIASAIAGARAYEEERTRAEALAELDRAKTAFFSNVSHEFRTPLTLVLGPVRDALARGTLAGPDLEAVHRNALRLLKLVNGLLDFARIEAGRMNAAYRPVDVAALTAELASTFRSAIETVGLEFAVDVRPPSGPPAYLDPELWEKIVLNLLSNALKFTFTGRIAVTLGGDDGHVVLEVADTGTGIPPAEIDRVFERFHRIEGVRARTHEGSGIGLALVRDLVRLHGGTIEARSVVDAGTTFTVRLPLGHAHLPEDQVRHEPAGSGAGPTAVAFVEESLRWLPGGTGSVEELESAAPAAGPTAPARIVVADDNADMRDYLGRLLRRWSIEAVADGAQALAAARRRRPDLVVADVMMPHLDGHGLVAALRADPATRSIPIVLLSARAGEESRVEGLAAGADDYLVKPFSAKELLARVSAQIELGRLRRQMEIEREKLQTLFAQAPAAIVVFRGPRHVIEFANSRYGRITGRVPAAIVGRAFDEAFPELAGSEVARVLDHVLATGVPMEHSEFAVAWDRDGRGELEHAHFDWLSQPLRDPDGTVAGSTHFLFDVSERVRSRALLEDARAAAETARRSAEAATRAKDEFLAMLGHELRNPLSPIVTVLDLMKLRGDASPEREILERQVAHLVRLVDDLLDVYRITRGKLELRLGPVETRDYVGRAVELASVHLERGGHRLELRVPPRGLVVEGDRDRLAQVVGNLLTNAAKYSPPGTRIAVHAERAPGAVRVTVRDEGAGIAPEMIGRIFELFVQHPQTQERAQGGLGLGLAIVRNLVRLHGGTVTAHSDGLGRGSTFVVELPLAARAPAPDGAAPAPGTLASRRAGSRVLVVDDNADAAATLARLLEQLGHRVATASDGPGALAAARRLRPQAALLDVGLPVMDGYEVAERLRAILGPEVALIAVTGYGQEQDRERSRQAGFRAHLVKPVDVQSLAELLDGVTTAST